MQRHLFVVIVCTGLAGATAADAGTRVNLESTLTSGAAYVYAEKKDVGSVDLEDLQTHEGLANRLAYDNSLLHVGINYQVLAVQLTHNTELNYLTHWLGLEADVNRWLRRYTGEGNLEMILGAGISPALPPLQNPQDPAATTQPPDLISQIPLVNSDVTSTLDDRSGKSIWYGMRYSDQLGLAEHYYLEWRVRDNRYNSEVVPDSRVLSVSGGYDRELLRGRTGFDLVHRRQLRKTGQRGWIWGASGYLGRDTRRYSWRVAPGAAYQTNTKLWRATLSLRGGIRGRSLALDGWLDSDVDWVDVGTRQEVRRIHRISLQLGPAGPSRFPTSLFARGSRSRDTRRLEAGLRQGFTITQRIGGSIVYQRSNLFVDDATLGVTRERRSDVATLNLYWRFL